MIKDDGLCRRRAAELCIGNGHLYKRVLLMPVRQLAAIDNRQKIEDELKHRVIHRRVEAVKIAILVIVVVAYRELICLYRRAVMMSHEPVHVRFGHSDHQHYGKQYKGNDYAQGLFQLKQMYRFFYLQRLPLVKCHQFIKRY